VRREIKIWQFVDSQDVLKFKRDFAPTDEYLSDLEANKIYFPLKTEAQRI